MITGKHVVEPDVLIHMQDLETLLEGRDPIRIKHDDINTAGPVSYRNDSIDRKRGTPRYEECDISVPGVVVENPSPGERYRLVDGGHRMCKSQDQGIYRSSYYVITFDEYKSFFRNRKGDLLNDISKDLPPSHFDFLKGGYTPSEDPTKYVYLRDLIPTMRGRHKVKLPIHLIDYEEVSDSQKARDLANAIPEEAAGIVVKKGTRYKLISDEHLLFKLEMMNTFQGVFIVLSEEELEPHYRDSKSGLLLSEERICLKAMHNVFGFSIPVFEYLNHDKYKSELKSEHCRYDSKSLNNSYERTSGKRSILESDSEATKDLKAATLAAYDCFYKHTYGLMYADKVEVTQSWLTRTPPSTSESEKSPMKMHKHFMSMACSTYYLKHKRGKGGNLSLVNPASFFMDNVAEFSMMRALGPTKGTEFIYELEIEESDIVVFPGGIHHQISPYEGEDERLSLPSNSVINPLRSSPHELSSNHYGYRFEMRSHNER